MGVEQDKKPRFDADLTPQHPDNQRAAAAHGLRFDAKKGAYVDPSGCKVRDRFGQPY
ncbi:MAG: hypothetical protein G01um101449_110 [Parcubacteria group bacterium Gr01-1014_49]|nr:MAG: hypothetical protein G01um101449_110 [Parcubacteria group bacterium Gr01-1014_49]